VNGQPTNCLPFPSSATRYCSDTTLTPLFTTRSNFVAAAARDIFRILFRARCGETRNLFITGEPIVCQSLAYKVKIDAYGKTSISLINCQPINYLPFPSSVKRNCYDTTLTPWFAARRKLHRLGRQVYF
jgi:hypothetical protein